MISFATPQTHRANGFSYISNSSTPAASQSKPCTLTPGNRDVSKTPTTCLRNLRLSLTNLMTILTITAAAIKTFENRSPNYRMLRIAGLPRLDRCQTTRPIMCRGSSPCKRSAIFVKTRQNSSNNRRPGLPLIRRRKKKEQPLRETVWRLIPIQCLKIRSLVSGTLFWE